ncbi:hypothetical protein DP114_22665 [Brasilonema sennae CENA114]|uniref:Uncharacterized protein n=1 Tax=Brasilonema sennae CENA114 TaxID=415709 RepID=A0A856MMA4_9CYAN|nr:hypothetical protein DP114_22665 [Brasilonema sennae CENA114]
MVDKRLIYKSFYTQILQQYQQRGSASTSRSQAQPGNEGWEAPPPDTKLQSKVFILLRCTFPNPEL